jgi:4,5-DOPA dioxygenase extradiol
MILGNGNVVHNLQLMQRRADAPAYDWATRFNDHIREAVLRGDDATAIDYQSAGSEASLAVPTPEHYLPLLYVLGARYPEEPLQILTDGIALGSISMLSLGAGVAGHLHAGGDT